MTREHERCPVCGRPTAGGDRVRAWPGKFAHRDCVSYSPRRRERTAAAGHRGRPRR